MKWQRELEAGRVVEAQRENAVLPPRKPVRVMFDEHGYLTGSIPGGANGVVAIKAKRLS